MIRPSPLRTTLLLLGPALAVCLLAAPAEARRHAKPSSDADAADPDQPTKGKTDKKGDKSKKAAADNAPTPLGQFGDWNAAAYAKGKAKTCYTLASPKERKPSGKREDAHVFISDRPAEKVRNQVSITMGFTVKESATTEAKVGSTSFDLVAQGGNAWIKDPAEEAKFVDALKHASKLVVKSAPTRGPATTDTYMLAGLKQALDRMTKECK